MTSTIVERRSLESGGAEDFRTSLLALRCSPAEQAAFSGIAKLLGLSVSELLRAGACSVLLRVLPELSPEQRGQVEKLVEGLAYSRRNAYAEHRARLRALAGLPVHQEAA